MITYEQKFFKNSSSFRKWLEKNHDKCSGIWLVMYKKHTGRKSIVYREALEESLCFGWIDTTIRKLDEERYIQKFMPRTNISNWSEVNRKIVDSLIKDGRMTEAGLKKIDVYIKTGKVDWKKAKPVRKLEMPSKVPAFIINEYKKNEPALSNFNSLSSSQKRNFILYIISAKKEETIKNRLAKTVDLLKSGKKSAFL